jgi:hypothetical protein
LKLVRIRDVNRLNLPCLIIAYSRPQGIDYLLDVLRESAVPRTYISIDGPRNDNDALNRSRILEIIERYRRDYNMKIEILSHEINLGVGAGVISAIDWFFSQESKGIVLEDDLRISKSFFQYAEESLSIYEFDPKVWMVSGTQLFPSSLNLNDCSWTNYPMIWGWAGWSSKWKLMRASLLQHKNLGYRHLFNYRYLYWAIGGNRALSGKVDTWDIPLAFEFYFQKKYCLLPPVNLVSNAGNDSVAAHTSGGNFPMNMPLDEISKELDYAQTNRKYVAMSYNKILEKKIFRISIKHLLLPIRVFLMDFYRFPKSKRRAPLESRLKQDVFNQL